MQNLVKPGTSIRIKKANLDLNELQFKLYIGVVGVLYSFLSVKQFSVCFYQVYDVTQICSLGLFLFWFLMFCIKHLPFGKLLFKAYLNKWFL